MYSVAQWHEGAVEIHLASSHNYEIFSAHRFLRLNFLIISGLHSSTQNQGRSRSLLESSSPDDITGIPIGKSKITLTEHIHDKDSVLHEILDPLAVEKVTKRASTTKLKVRTLRLSQLMTVELPFISKLTSSCVTLPCIFLF